MSRQRGYFKRRQRGSPGGSVVKNPPAGARDMGSIPGQEGSHMAQSNEARAPELLSLRARAWKPQLLGPHAAATETHLPVSPSSASRSRHNEKSAQQ